LEPLLKTEHVSKNYGAFTALRDVSLAVPKGSIFGLLGPNGAGKTSLIRIINQITAPDSGHVYFDGQPLAQKHVSNIGYLPEERGLYKKMRVGEQCLYLAQLKGMSKKDATVQLKKWFDKFEITSWWNKNLGELSKGMQQKIQFIITVVHSPALLILDEPFSGFDPINAQIIRDEILELKQQGTTIIFSTHNMGSVEELCDQICLLNKAEKILEGSVEAVKANYGSATFLAELKGHATSLGAALWGFELLESSQLESGNVLAKIKLLGKNTPNNLLHALIKEMEVVSFKEYIPSMNDIFIRKVTEINEQQPEATSNESTAEVNG